MTEQIADSGDVFALHECDDCGGLVIEFYLTKTPGVRASSWSGPRDTIDVPPELAEWFRAEVNKWADEVQRRGTEDEG